MGKLEQLLNDGPVRKRYVELTADGPVLTESTKQPATYGSVEVLEVTESQWLVLQEQLQTGQLDNAKVRDIIKGTPE
jgi:hypothetical protein